MSKRKVIKKILRIKLLWTGLCMAGMIALVWYAPKLSEPVAADPIKIGYIGDSITQGPKDARNAVDSEVASLGKDFAAVNRGKSGTTTANWLPGYPLFDDALASFKAQNVHVVSIMLGVNDARTDIAMAPAVYKKNLSTIIAGLLASGTIKQVIVNYPTYVVAGVGLWDTTSVARLKRYMSCIDDLAKEKNIARGDTKAFGHFQEHVNELVDGVHPNNEGNRQLGRLWAYAYERIMSEQLAKRAGLSLMYTSS